MQIHVLREFPQNCDTNGVPNILVSESQIRLPVIPNGVAPVNPIGVPIMNGVISPVALPSIISGVAVPVSQRDFFIPFPLSKGVSLVAVVTVSGVAAPSVIGVDGGPHRLGIGVSPTKGVA